MFKKKIKKDCHNCAYNYRCEWNGRCFNNPLKPNWKPATYYEK